MSQECPMMFTQDQAYHLVYAAREAQIRYKRARTEKNKGNPAYQMWDDDTPVSYTHLTLPTMLPV